MAIANSSVVFIGQFSNQLIFHLWNKEFDLKKTAGVFHDILFIGRVRLFICLLSGGFLIETSVCYFEFNKNKILKGHSGCVESFLLLKTGQKHNLFIEIAGKPVLS